MARKELAGKAQREGEKSWRIRARGGIDGASSSSSFSPFFLFKLEEERGLDQVVDTHRLSQVACACDGGQDGGCELGEGHEGGG